MKRDWAKSLVHVKHVPCKGPQNSFISLCQCSDFSSGLTLYSQKWKKKRRKQLPVRFCFGRTTFSLTKNPSHFCFAHNYTWGGSTLGPQFHHILLFIHHTSHFTFHHPIHFSANIYVLSMHFLVAHVIIASCYLYVILHISHFTIILISRPTYMVYQCTFWYSMWSSYPIIYTSYFTFHISHFTILFICV